MGNFQKFWNFLHCKYMNDLYVEKNIHIGDFVDTQSSSSSMNFQKRRRQTTKFFSLPKWRQTKPGKFRLTPFPFQTTNPKKFHNQILALKSRLWFCCGIFVDKIETLLWKDIESETRLKCFPVYKALRALTLYPNASWSCPNASPILPQNVPKANLMHLQYVSKTSPKRPQFFPNASQMRLQFFPNASLIRPQCVPNTSPMRLQYAPNSSPKRPQSEPNASPICL